mgnify:CR=1 FL=1
MRIIAGSARGIPLMPPPKDMPIRPTLDRVREALFSILAHRVDGGRFLDLFAGSGANGIEALSRGAAEAVFADADARALKLVRANLEKTRLERHGVCLRLNIPQDLRRLNGSFSIIFADPPYAFSGHAALLAGVGEHGLLAPEGILVFEHARKTVLPDAVSAFQRYRIALYGDTGLSFYSQAIASPA